MRGAEGTHARAAIDGLSGGGSLCRGKIDHVAPLASAPVGVAMVPSARLPRSAGAGQPQVLRAENAAIMGKDRDRADRQTIAFIDQHRVFDHLFAAVFSGPHWRSASIAGSRSRPFFGQAVFDLAAIIGAGLALEDAVFDQLGEAVGQDVAGDAKLAQKFLEMLEPVESWHAGS